MADSEGGPAVRSKLRWIWDQVTSRLWFRVSLYGLAAVVTPFVAAYATPLIPPGLAGGVVEGAARDVLAIIASSMLVVATFSLGTMVSAFSAAANSATPRAARILIDDPFSQNVIATFLGAFVFSIVGLMAHSLGYYDQTGEAVLLIASGLVILVVLGAFFGWLDHLANMVRLGETTRKVADRSEAVIRARAEAPHLGGVAPEGDGPRHRLAPTATGYVQHIDMPGLDRVAEKAGGRIAVDRAPGALADPTLPLVRTSWEVGDDEARAIRDAFTLGLERSFDQDPRFCLQVLAEIGSRALSPGVNDPGTAISIISVQQRLLALWAAARDAAGSPEPTCPRVSLPALSVDDMFEDAFAPLMRDGAHIVEVGLRLQKTLAALAARGNAFEAASREISGRALAHAERALALDSDNRRLTEAAARIGERDAPDGAPRLE